MDGTPLAASRKRSRSASPAPPSMMMMQMHKETNTTTATAAAAAASTRDDATLALGLQDPLRRDTTLNHLLQLSASHENNFHLTGDAVLKQLADMAIYDCFEWTEPKNLPDTKPAFSSQQAWLRPPTARMAAWVQHCQNQLDPKRSTLNRPQYHTLAVILVILRNLSFVGANLRLLAYSPDILAILTGCLYEGYDPTYDSLGVVTSTSGAGAAATAAAASSSSSSGNSMTLALSAIQTLVHLAPHLDVSGQKLLSDKLFYAPHYSTDGPAVPDASSFGLASTGNWGFGAIWLSKRLDTKEDTVADVDKDFILSLTVHQLVCVWSIFSGITHMLTDSKSPRPVLLMAVDLLQELIGQARVGVVGSVQLKDNEDEIPALRAILVHMPDSILERLTDFLFVPRLGPDGLDYIDPLHHVVTRVTTLKLLMGYDATVDTDVRDRTLDVLVPLLELDSPRMASRLGRETISTTAGQQQPQEKKKIRTRLYDALVPILTTHAGRNEASLLALQLFRELSASPDNRLGLLYVQDRLVELASRDARVSQLVWNHLYAIPDDDEDEDASSLASKEGNSGSDGGAGEDGTD